jgi:putative FmdB family regulatory protein
MPLYEYYCADCETKFDTLRTMSKADSPIQCKNCESMHTSRSISLFSAFSKGEGSTSHAVAGGGCGGCAGGSCGSCGVH